MSAVGKYEAVIGIEIHVQLLTRTKMFCGCEQSFADRPNTHTCPVCLAHPGALPVTNAEAVRLGILTGLALGCEIAAESTFHRKNYFYPDLPKAYQISQYDEPLCIGGEFTYLQEDGEKTVRITRVHLEEDAAKLLHLSGSGRRAGAEQSAVDFNRGGTPLVEIVTEPDLHSGQDAADFLKQLRQTLREVGVSDCNMDEGSMRADANVSIRPVGSTALGTKTELKNMNSFTFLRRGIEAEIARQTALVEAGGRVVQETLHFDPTTGELTALRSKEEAHDYRYFPEPDLTPIAPDRAWVAQLRDGLPELPVARRRRYRQQLGVTFEDAEVLTETVELSAWFEQVAVLIDPKIAANWVRGELRALLVERGEEPWQSKVTPQGLATLIQMVEDGEVNRSSAKETVLPAMAETGADPRHVVDEHGLGTIGDGDALRAIVAQVIADNPKQAQQLRDGQDKLAGFFVGQVMKATQGRADAKTVGDLVKALIAG
jgi:aspartyl-tRNA(Asn)/glutamyl-tRNA(Gln) amidotransferase subunit B